MRRFFPLVAVLAALVVVSGAGGKTLFVVKGKGNGHGVGLSQWGAYGLAKGYAVDHAYAYGEIVAHYFPGTTLGDRSGVKVRVLLAGERTSVTIRSGARFSVSDGSRSASHDAGAARVTKTSTGRIKVEGIRGAFDSPATFSPTTRYLKLGWAPYRGDLVVSVVGGRLQVVNRVGIDAYVRGVVTRESLDSWGDVGAQEALNAQAIVARSYALYKVAHGGGNCGGFLCPDVRDQVYGGVSGETANGNEAVNATAGKVVLSSGAVAETFFSSSSGGRTAASVDTWGGDLPYLQSIADPADINPDNPHRSWTVLFTPRGLAARLGTRRPRDAVVTERASGRVKSLTLRGAGWSQTITDKAEYFRTALGLKSSRVWVGVQSLRAGRSTVECREAVTLYVFAHDVGPVSLEQRPSSGGTWTAISLRQIDEAHWRSTRHPCVSTDYRVVSPRAVGPHIRVSVSPTVAFSAAQQADGLAGQVSPAPAGSALAVERRTPFGWVPVAQATVGDDGGFRAAFSVSGGVYRAKVVPPSATGLVAGYSPNLTVLIG